MSQNFNEKPEKYPNMMDTVNRLPATNPTKTEAVITINDLFNEREIKIITDLAGRNGTTLRGAIRQGARLYQNEVEPRPPINFPPIVCMGD